MVHKDRIQEINISPSLSWWISSECMRADIRGVCWGICAGVRWTLFWRLINNRTMTPWAWEIKAIWCFQQCTGLEHNFCLIPAQYQIESYLCRSADSSIRGCVPSWTHQPHHHFFPSSFLLLFIYIVLKIPLFVQLNVSFLL